LGANLVGFVRQNKRLLDGRFAADIQIEHDENFQNRRECGRQAGRKALLFLS
jgi:hypothetical protein